MNREQEQDFRAQMKPHLAEYIKKTTYQPSSSVIKCPVCGTIAYIDTDGNWQCMQDGSHKGDTLDYAYHQYHCDSYEKAARIIVKILKSNVSFFNCMPSAALLDMEFSSTPQYLVDKLIGKGLYLLSGAPKIGKSWLVLWLADCVSNGLPVWDYETEKSGVLYISLEDTFQRLQSRLCDISSGDTPNLMITTSACSLGEGFEEQLNRYLIEYPNTGLVIIDTLQRIRKATLQYNYGEDYDAMNTLKQIADRYNTTILLVHHNRKMDSDDPIDNISGTSGISGAVDGMLILKRKQRGQSDATLYVTGRDHPDTTITLSFNRTTKKWIKIDSDDNTDEEAEDPLLERINTFLSGQNSWRGKATELLKELGIEDMKPNTLSRKLNCHKGYLLQKYNIEYSTYRLPDSRIINLVKQT